MFNDLNSKFTIEDEFCIATEVVEHDREMADKYGHERKYPTYRFEGESIVKYQGKHYRHRRILDNFEIKPLGLTAQDIIRGCQGPIRIEKPHRH